MMFLILDLSLHAEDTKIDYSYEIEGVVEADSAEEAIQKW